MAAPASSSVTKVDGALGRGDLIELGVERDGEQEAEQHLYAGLGDSDLLQQLRQVAVTALQRRLVARV